MHLPHWFRRVVLVQLEELVDEVELLALDGKQLEGFLGVV